jgi:hypothetical protein
VNRLCTLEQARGRLEPCEEERCAFWLSEPHENRCVLDGVERELLARPRVAHYLLELRRDLETANPRRGHGH